MVQFACRSCKYLYHSQEFQISLLAFGRESVQKLLLWCFWIFILHAQERILNWFFFSIFHSTCHHLFHSLDNFRFFSAINIQPSIWAKTYFLFVGLACPWPCAQLFCGKLAIMKVTVSHILIEASSLECYLTFQQLCWLHCLETFKFPSGWDESFFFWSILLACP